MTKAEKYISGVKERTQKKIDALWAEAEEARIDWANTGYTKFSKKQARLEAEANMLEEFINPFSNKDKEYYAEQLRNLKNKAERLDLLFKSVENVVNEQMLTNYKGSTATKQLQRILSEWKFN